MGQTLTAAQYRAQAGNEQSLHTAIMDYLRRTLPESVMPVTLNNNPRSKVAGAIGKRMGVLKGIPDIALIRSISRVAFIEVKTAKGRLSPEQRAFQGWCRDWGVDHCVARSVDDVQDFIEALGIETREAA